MEFYMLRPFPFHSFKFKLYWVMMLERKWWWQRWGISSVNDKNLERRKPKREEEGESVKICLSKSVLGYRLKAYVSLSLSVSIWDLKEKLTKRMEILFDLFNGENLRGYTGVRATKRFTIYLISNILFFYHFI